MEKSILDKKNIIIAGPCSAESEEQLIRTALELKQTKKVDVLRAGIWKPRTNPGYFEGVGTKGLSWLLEAKKVTGLPTAVEVATPKHVEDALAFDTDILWIGARTTVNPFSVQEIANALKGTKTEILIKNPVSADIKLWIGALERIQKSGIENIGLIHRGFTSIDETELRNSPLWQIPIEMKRLFPNIPLICDPSHIAGNKEYIQSISQKSIDLAYDGLMIESHFNPEIALTDKAQQVTPYELLNIIEHLQYKSDNEQSIDYQKDLEVLRSEIDSIDNQILQLLSNRMNVSKNIGILKKNNNVTVFQANRWNEILQKTIQKGKKHQLSTDFLYNYMEQIHLESIRIQNLD